MSEIVLEAFREEHCTPAQLGKPISAIDALFPNRAIFEYLLQRLRLVCSSKTRVIEVADIRDLPESDDRDQFPSIEVKLRIRGLKLKNPVTAKSQISETRLKEYFEGDPMQKSFLRWFARYIAESIPPTSPEIRLKRKLGTLQEGRPGKLPPRADLKLMYELAVRQLSAVKDFLWKHPTRNRRELSHQDRQFLEEASTFFWWRHVEHDEITLDDIENSSAKSTALQLLMLRYSVEEDALKSRLFRRE